MQEFCAKSRAAIVKLCQFQVVAQFEFCPCYWRHPDASRFPQRGEGSPPQLLCASGDPALRLKNGSARDDAIVAGEIQTEPLPNGESERTMTDPHCLFCRIVRAELPAKRIYEDDHVFAFEDIHPKAPTHVLVVPKKHIVGLKEAEPGDAEVIGRCHLVAAQIARERKIENGYRTVLNVGPESGQSVFHLHVHLLGGRRLTWPPG